MFTTNLFQFHKGTIRTAQQEELCHGEADFNSIKVRLELQYDALTKAFQ